MSEQAHGEAESGTAEQQVRVCEWPGCGRPVVWAGRGRPPRWCLEVVDGVRHTAVNAHRARGGAPATVSTGLAVDGVTDGGVGERPVSRAVSYTHLRAHETDSYLVCRLLLEKKKTK